MSPRPIFDRPIAHRGLHDRAAGVIENSRSAFEAAIEGNYTIECDVHVSKDGVPVVFHDDDLERLTGIKGPIGNRDLAELQTVPLLDSAKSEVPLSFDEFLALISGRTLLQIELKRQRTPQMSDTLARTVAAGLASYVGPVTVESFDPGLLTRIRRSGYKGPLGIITYGYDNDDWDKSLTGGQRIFLRHLLHWPWTRFNFISCFFKSLNLPAVRAFRALGMPVTAWTVRSVEEKRTALAGADQIVFEGFDPQSA